MGGRFHPRRAWLLRLYPAAWRKRYGDEFAALLEDEPPTLANLLDVVLGALDAHLHADLLPGEVYSMTSRLRTSAITIWCAFAVFVFSYLAFGRMTDPQAPFDSVAQTHMEVRLAWNAIAAGADLAALAVLVGGVPVVLAALTDAWRQRRRALLALLAWPVGGVICCAALLLIAELIAPPIPPGQRVRPDTGAFALVGVAFFAVAFLTFVGGTVSVAYLVSRSTLGERALRFAVWPATIAVVAMGVTLIATLLWSFLLWRDDPPIYSGLFGDCANTQCYGPTGDIGIGIVLFVAGLMALALLLASFALRRAFAARALASA